MYAQMVYKDRKIMELNNKILEGEKVLMDVQEMVNEKSEVLRSKDSAFQVLAHTGRKTIPRLIDIISEFMASSRVFSLTHFHTQILTLLFYKN